MFLIVELAHIIIMAGLNRLWSNGDLIEESRQRRIGHEQCKGYHQELAHECEALEVKIKSTKRKICKLRGEIIPQDQRECLRVDDVYRLMFIHDVSLWDLTARCIEADLTDDEIQDLITHLKKCETTIPRQARCSLNFCLQSEDPITPRTALECVKTRNYDKCFLIQSAFVKPDGLLWAEVDELTSWVDSQQQFVNHSACWESFSLPISAYINAIRGNVEKADIDALLGKIKTEYIPIDLLVSITLCVLSGNPVFIEAVAKLYEAEGRYECEPRDFCCKY
eukprot:GHVH01017229.1.p1 GENE.GHVH01017229.1~~GHVH01017229.1.p1  ORF type:complete len:280 (-),score=36.76 GHVH01017229.1:25-864(-)